MRSVIGSSESEGRKAKGAGVGQFQERAGV